MRLTPKSSDDSRPETNETRASKQKSTTSDETVVDPGEAPIAIDSPQAILTKQTTHGEHSPAVVVLEKLGPWIIVLTAVAAMSMTCVILILIFGPRYMEAMIEAEVAQAETRIRTGTAQDTAEAKATAHVARTSALTALDKVEDLRVKLAPNVVLDGH
jgi:hypothetical protein